MAIGIKPGVEGGSSLEVSTLAMLRPVVVSLNSEPVLGYSYDEEVGFLPLNIRQILTEHPGAQIFVGLQASEKARPWEPEGRSILYGFEVKDIDGNIFLTNGVEYAQLNSKSHALPVIGGSVNGLSLQLQPDMPLIFGTPLQITGRPRGFKGPLESRVVIGDRRPMVERMRKSLLAEVSEVLVIPKSQPISYKLASTLRDQGDLSVLNLIVRREVGSIV